MAMESPASGPTSEAAAAAPKPAPKPQNPALRMLGLPSIKLKLPSRNWMIFLTVTGSFIGALVYDRREKKKIQEKWANMVAHLADEPLRTTEARRKVTVFLSAPPGDSLRNARDHFRDYVKPILVSGALDYEVVEGRREGDLRAAIASRIRRKRELAGESGPLPEPDLQTADFETKLRHIRAATGVHDEPETKGDLVLGRHAWKEYIRGIHEGWLGPLIDPASLQPAVVEDNTPKEPLLSDTPDQTSTKEPPKDEKEEAEKPAEKTKPSGPPASYLLPSAYHTHQISPIAPTEFDGSAPVAFPHILGFLNTPIRTYRFLNRRHLADKVGEQVAAAVLASSIRPYADNTHSSESDFSSITQSQPQNSTSDGSSPSSDASTSEQQFVLQEEEKDWHKSAYKQPTDPAEIREEREWTDPMTLDPRISSRMRRFVLSPDELARSQRIAEGKEWVIGQEKPVHVPVWKSLWATYGWGEEENARSKVIIGNLDGEDGE
ncbi:hypothetical protein H112_01671 [Trichophyton rubrum D6]|uniref:Mitochondrial import inner membrane translocase subunit TIM54 n=3 Tax=Trichophyton rubrum TaxID=5551 RepID=A0A178F6Q6_TRIRU|nr:uncharacterized protein TERG_07303 [Trichophyton rubrum CBS 118892]EZF26133.1 hypothetical protein H100_01667 [Trichophyton rubrum MR850]EZF45141.1 hypothetical protein H102_01659 [Trichophyton rubrum CBS 100081]EZF55774.1 hypothetical protein H103_01673 [Trichophyton rubrum CBS 288.86]EZF66389.1 hypothetical protein H104_01648 [Trichophyton rubrum CBS 289.86]EZF87683.1 hypothetical protein H110_01671 [Trichophyton rubrum MR1448]EZF98487.1 hypothetical protein H113_01670 [Trichophyton rubr